MPDKLSLCLDCTGLVGAGPSKDAHGALESLAKDSAGKSDVFHCSACGCRWARGQLGWARLVD